LKRGWGCREETKEGMEHLYIIKLIKHYNCLLKKVNL